MKKRQKPSVKQRKIIESKGLNSNDWFVVKHLLDQLILVNRYVDQEKIIWIS